MESSPPSARGRASAAAAIARASSLAATPDAINSDYWVHTERNELNPWGRIPDGPSAGPREPIRRPRASYARIGETAAQRLEAMSISNRAPRIEAGPSALSIFMGICVRPRRRQISALTPMTESSGPLMPRSVI